mmetsp:Transcript_61253/g.109018  ORF Transcript_61253/g.109018 Transcript_61253/m.109018 type:complete len:106 (+) Transcript_61253:593-910(+)
MISIRLDNVCCSAHGYVVRLHANVVTQLRTIPVLVHCIFMLGVARSEKSKKYLLSFSSFLRLLQVATGSAFQRIGQTKIVIEFRMCSRPRMRHSFFPDVVDHLLA